MSLLKLFEIQFPRTDLCRPLSLADVASLGQCPQSRRVRLGEGLNTDDAFEQVQNLLTQTVQLAVCNIRYTIHVSNSRGLLRHNTN